MLIGVRGLLQCVHAHVRPRACVCEGKEICQMLLGVRGLLQCEPCFAKT